MPQNAVLVVHGVDVPLGRHGLQRVVRFLVGSDGIILHIEAAVVLRYELSVEIGDRRHHHVVIGPGGLGKIRVQLRVGFAGIEHVDSDDRGTAVGVRVQRFQRHGHDVAAPGLVRADILHGALVDADDEDVAVQRLGLLIEPVGKHLVRLIKQPRKGRGCKQGGEKKGNHRVSDRLVHHSPPF